MKTIDPWSITMRILPMFIRYRSNRRYCVIAFLIILQLSACTVETTLPASNQIETSVAATLMSIPTWTSPPSATLPVAATATPPATSSATEMPTSGPSPTPSPPPLPEGDPRTGLNLSVPHYRDGFNQSTTWGGPNSEAALNMIRDGQLFAIDYLTDSYIWWSTPLVQGSNFYVEVTAISAACYGKDAAGLGIRIGGESLNSGYTLEISCDGHYRLRKFNNGLVDTLREWTPSPEILQGPNATNRIGMAARGSLLHVSINREIIDEVEDFTYYNGTFALYANAAETAGLTITFDDFEIWYF